MSETGYDRQAINPLNSRNTVKCRISGAGGGAIKCQGDLSQAFHPREYTALKTWATWAPGSGKCQRKFSKRIRNGILKEKWSLLVSLPSRFFP